MKSKQYDGGPYIVSYKDDIYEVASSSDLLTQFIETLQEKESAVSIPMLDFSQGRQGLKTKKICIVNARRP